MPDCSIPWVGARSALGGVLSAAFACSSAASEPASAAAPPPVVESRPAATAAPSSSANDAALAQVTIEARREALQRRVDAFIRGITHDLRYETETLPRWRQPVCFAVAGLPREAGVFALQRLSQIARAAAVPLARRPCQYNFFVVFSATPDRFLAQAFHLHRQVFDDSRGLAPVRRFISPAKPQAVRVWHNWHAVSRNGAPIPIGDAACGSFSVGGNAIPVSCQYQPSRIEFYDVLEFSLAFVVVDTSFPKAAKLGQVVDFAALVGLADIDLDDSVGDAPSILQLFGAASDAAPAGLTSWDQAFLSGLYSTDQGSTMQRSQIGVHMVHEISR